MVISRRAGRVTNKTKLLIYRGSDKVDLGDAETIVWDHDTSSSSDAVKHQHVGAKGVESGELLVSRPSASLFTMHRGVICYRLHRQKAVRRRRPKGAVHNSLGGTGRVSRALIAVISRLFPCFVWSDDGLWFPAYLRGLDALHDILGVHWLLHAQASAFDEIDSQRRDVMPFFPDREGYRRVEAWLI